MCVYCKECKPLMPENKAQFVGVTLKEKGSTRQSTKQTKKVDATGDKLLNDVIGMAINISIASIKGFAGIPLMSVTSPLPAAKTAHAMNARKDLLKSKDLNTMINKKIATIFSHQEKKEKADLNKFEALSISYISNAGKSNNKSKVSCTSNKESDSE
eukprot:9682046-Ditylum_brightwellii.AAC.1